MEVSTVSPPPTSPTEGPNPCGISVTNMAIDSVTLLICLCGVVGNGAVLCLLHINPVTDYIFNQAMTDFLFLIFTVPSTLLFLVEEVSCSAILPLMYLSLLFQLSLFSYNMGLYRLTAISIQRCTSIHCQFCSPCQIPQHFFWVVGALLWNLSLTLIVVFPMLISLCPSHEQEHCRVVLTSMFAIILLLFAALLVISSTIHLIKAKCGSQQQQLKRLDIVIFLVALFALPSGLCNFLQQLGYTAVSSQLVFLLACINSTIKPFIYFLVGSWRRDYSLGTCWTQCSVESCRRHCSMGSIREALLRAFEEGKDSTAHSDDATMDTEV